MQLKIIFRLVSSVLRWGRTFGGNSTFYINLLETSMNIMISLEKWILKSNLFVKTYTQIYDETHSLIKPFYFVNYEMNSIIEGMFLNIYFRKRLKRMNRNV